MKCRFKSGSFYLLVEIIYQSIELGFFPIFLAEFIGLTDFLDEVGSSSLGIRQITDVELFDIMRFGLGGLDVKKPSAIFVFDRELHACLSKEKGQQEYYPTDPLKSSL
jgi:hypothetical protein